jgi:hypothetical protein
MPIGKIEAIKKFFEAGGGRKLAMSELQALTPAERQELAVLCAVELGETIKEV